MLGDRLGLTIDVRGDRSIRADGSVRGRRIVVEIDGTRDRGGFARNFFGINTISSRNRREKWHTMAAVGITGESAMTGEIHSAVDVRDPAWNPREYNPRNGRKVWSEPTQLAQRLLTAETHESLMSISDDVQIRVEPNAIRIVDDSTAIPDSGPNYVAGSLIHHFTGPIPPWPERALIGPTWWIDLLCDLADSAER